MFPKSKILSPNSTLGATQTVNINIADGNNSSSANLTPNENEKPSIVSRDVNIIDEPEIFTDDDKNQTINFLKLVLQAYMNNPIKLNELVICTVPFLEKLIETLTGCDDCTVMTSEPEINCCGSVVNLHFVPISKIWVKNGESVEVFKYKYSNFLQLFDKYKISLKMVYVE